MYFNIYFSNPFTHYFQKNVKGRRIMMPFFNSFLNYPFQILEVNYNVNLFLKTILILKILLSPTRQQISFYWKERTIGTSLIVKSTSHINSNFTSTLQICLHQWIPAFFQPPALMSSLRKLFFLEKFGICCVYSK